MNLLTEGMFGNEVMGEINIGEESESLLMDPDCTLITIYPAKVNGKACNYLLLDYKGELQVWMTAEANIGVILDRYFVGNGEIQKFYEETHASDSNRSSGNY
ncbi:hypothetical protein HZY91_02695 [Facklamia sp. DSM 111018]|uniref:Uncharacterized protein n=1 Tax=Facklamia lactis TaxID=2749967 RepID=A0ABS0LNR7_9LACT|nr:hypothetical protein [Facklamia lactis]MBG9985798.1 hypothetical protein [Facklamia lactis]